MTIIQEKFLSTRWKRNLMCSYAVCLKDRLTDRGFRNNNSNPIIGEGVGGDSSGKWSWVKRGRRKYKREAHFRIFFEEDQTAARDCIRRAANSSRRDWSTGSRPFFWRWPKHGVRVVMVEIILLGIIFLITRSNMHKCQ